MRGLKCHKSLYLNKNYSDLRDDISAQQQAIFSQGTDVGILAQQLFPGGVDVSPESYYDFSQSIADTQKAIAKGETVIYEAAFQFDEVLCAIDILVKDEEGWKAYEVKSSTGVSETYIEDTALQYYVITNAGIPLIDMSVIYINNQYIKNGDLDIARLFSVQSVLHDVKNLQHLIPQIIVDEKKTLQGASIPNIDIGHHCFSPYSCDFMGHCWKHIPGYSVFDIANLFKTRKFELYDKGIINLDQIPKDYNLNTNQWMQVNCELDQEAHIDKTKIQKFLDHLNYPLYFLDFETMATAIPIFDNTKPYQQFVFQYSLHIQDKPGGELKHYEYLAQTPGASLSVTPDEMRSYPPPAEGSPYWMEGGAEASAPQGEVPLSPGTNIPGQSEAKQELCPDPRIGFINQLIKDCGTTGDIIVYNVGFEKGKLHDLIKVFPQHKKEIQAIIDRLVDLMIPFQKRWYYTPEMKGRYTIKYVLPALVPELSYSDLEISEGGTASNTFTEMVTGTFKGDITKTRNDLLEYCKLDTFAMVRIFEKLYQ